ncbi:zinc finger domain-containing protein [Streptomyces sp. HJ7]
MKQSGVVSDDFKHVESRDCPMSTCAAPAGSPCRTGKGKVTIQHHTARFRLVPQLTKAPNVPTPAVRKPGSPWTEPPRPTSAGAQPVGQVHLGYARVSTTRQSLDAQPDSPAEARRAPQQGFALRISHTRASASPERSRTRHDRPRLPGSPCAEGRGSALRRDKAGKGRRQFGGLLDQAVGSQDHATSAHAISPWPRRL